MPAPEKAERCRAILGVPENADLDMIKKAFRRKVLTLHPDVNPGDAIAAEAFKKVTAAYEYLKSITKTEKKSSGRETSITKATPQTYAPAEPVAPRKTDFDLSAEELLIRLNHSENPHVRLYALKAISEMGGKECVWAIINSLGDPDRAVVAAGVDALGGLRAKIATMPLVSLHREADPELKIRIEAALSEINTPMAAAFLEKTARTAPEIRKNATKENFEIA